PDAGPTRSDAPTRTDAPARSDAASRTPQQPAAHRAEDPDRTESTAGERDPRRNTRTPDHTVNPS
ncbi:MAG: hypothetical protein WCA46_30160, partial [Actinocatenispora sp.]